MFHRGAEETVVKGPRQGRERNAHGPRGPLLAPAEAR